MSRPFASGAAAFACAALLTLAALAIRPTPATAQLPIPAVSIMGGVSQFDLSRTGTAPFGAVRLEVPFPIIIIEGSLGAFRPKEQDVQRTYIIPEAQLQWQILPFLVRPYIGVGGGWFRAVSGPDPHPSDLTGSVSAGVRAGIPLIRAGLRAELRVRGIGSGFGSSTAEWTVGLRW